MNRIIHIVVALLIIGFYTQAQTNPVRLLTIKQLEKRIANPDTLYIVNFWATWCGPCVKELPDFDKLQTVYKGKPLKVLLISMDFKSKLAEVKAFTKKNKLLSEVFLADKASDQEFIDKIDKRWSGALPATLLLNNKKHTSKFYEQEFTYAKLNRLYLSNQ